MRVSRLIPSLLVFVIGLATRPAPAAELDFATWLEGVREEALAAGITPATLDRALDDLQPLPSVIEHDHQQAEATVPFTHYVQNVVNKRKQAAARQQLAENRALLEEIGKRYGVQPRYIVALWGIETSFGRGSGNFPVIASLATLAYDGRRGAFFRGELIDALKIADEEHIDPKEMRGSWAGAMGQSQFMPSSFLTYAVSYSGDGKRDIWHRRADVFASIANYLARSGWHDDQTWGREVKLPPSFDPSLLGLGVKKPLAEWARLGVRRRDGGKLSDKDIEASLLRPGGDQGPALLVYDNFRTVMKWNSSTYFASAVGYLADSMEQR